MPQVLLDILVQVVQVLLNLEMLVYFNGLFKTSLHLLLPLLALDELLNGCRRPILLWLLALSYYLSGVRHWYLLR